jgi:hypothetical protein
MGLLDEAIREHLELKRRGGADPTAVELEEQEALAPVLPDGDAVAEGDGTDHPQEPAAATSPPSVAPLDDEHSGDARLAELSSVGQDTAELDMRTVLGEDVDAANDAATVAPVQDGAQPAHDDGSQQDPLGWGISGEADREPAPEEVPGQERLSFD